MLSSSTMNGTDVVNLAGESLGNIKDLMIDTSTGDVSYAVLSFGGFLGMGDKYFAIPWQSLTVDTVKEHIVLNVDKERLKNAPGFAKDHWPGSADDYYTRVRTYYLESEPA